MTDSVRRLRIEVGAAMDSTIASVLRSVTQMQKQAAKEQAQAAKQAASAVKQAAKESAAAQKQAAKEVRDEIKKNAAAALQTQKTLDAYQKRAAKDQVSEAKRKASEMKKLEDDVAATVKRNLAEKTRLYKQGMAEVERDLRRHNAERRREEASASGGGGGSGGGGIGRRSLASRVGTALATRAAAAAISMPGRALGGLMRGFGVEMSATDMLQGAVDRQRAATSISNQAWIPHEGAPAGADQKVDPNLILQKATDVGIKTGTDTSDLLAGLDKYVAHTGDLKTGLETMEELARVSKANGANFQDMAQAASEISNEMGDIPNKGKAIGQVLRALAGQGQMTAIELKDQAKNVAMLTSQSNFFKIDPMSSATLNKAGVTDEVGQRMAVVSGLAQMARSKGGRVTAKTAMQSAMAFMRDLANPNEVKRMHAAGLNVYADEGHTKVRDPLQMLLESFRVGRRKGGISRDVINNLFPNQQSRAVTNAFSQDYNDAYEKAAREGVTDELKRHQYAAEQVTAGFQKLLAVVQSNEQVDIAFAASMQTADSRVKVLNNQLGKATNEIMLQLLPALIMLAPYLVSLATGISEVLSTITGSASSNPEIANAEGKATAVTKALRATQATGVRDNDLGSKGIEARMSLEKAIEEQKKDMDKFGDQDFDNALFGGGNHKLKNVSREELERTANFEGDSKTKRMAKERLKQLDTADRLQKELGELRGAIGDNFSKALHDKPIEVIIKNQPLPGANPKSNGQASVDSSTSEQ